MIYNPEDPDLIVIIREDQTEREREREGGKTRDKSKGTLVNTADAVIRANSQL